MANRNNNYYRNNKEFQKQQQRKQQFKKDYSVEVFGNDKRVTLEEEKKEENYYLNYNGIDYQIDNGYMAFIKIMTIQDRKDKIIRQEKLDVINGRTPKVKYTAKDSMLDFDETLRVGFAPGEYDKFMENNPSISLIAIQKVAEAIVTLMSASGVANEQDNFRNK